MTNRPNILIIHADQLRYDGLGCDGNPYACAQPQQAATMRRIIESSLLMHRRPSLGRVCAR